MYNIGEIVGGWKIISGPYSLLAPAKREVFYTCLCSNCNEPVAQRSYNLWQLRVKGRATVCRPCTLRNRNTIHGQAGSRLHNIWRGMRQRCRDENHISASTYHDKGIVVCQAWSEFAPFNEWALANGYQDGLTIDRIDPNKNYCPENCRWITRSANSKGTANPVKRDDGVVYKNRDEAALAMGCNSVSITTAIHRGTRIYGHHFSYIYKTS